MFEKHSTFQNNIMAGFPAHSHNILWNQQSNLKSPKLIISRGDTPSSQSMNPTIWLILDMVSDSLCPPHNTMGQKDYHDSVLASSVFLE